MLIFRKVRSNYQNLNIIRHTILYNENISVTLNPSDKPRWTWYDAVISRSSVEDGNTALAVPGARLHCSTMEYRTMYGVQFLDVARYVGTNESNLPRSWHGRQPHSQPGTFATHALTVPASGVAQSVKSKVGGDSTVSAGIRQNYGGNVIDMQLYSMIIIVQIIIASKKIKN